MHSPPHLRLSLRPSLFPGWPAFVSIVAVLAGIAALPQAAPAQTFVAEWAQQDIGRIGPTGMAIDTVDGVTYLYVSDDPGGRIIKIDLATGTRVAVWGRTGTGPLEFNGPHGIAVDPVSHDLYIAERINQRVQRITANGEFVMGWGQLGLEPGRFDNPIGIAADAQGNVYVAENNNCRVQKFAVRRIGAGWEASLVTAWGGVGSENGKFLRPYGLALDPGGNVWVADGDNHRLQKFDPSGRFLGAFGTFGSGDGQFITPTWIHFDVTGAYYVSETNSDPRNPAAADLANQRIQKFAPDGRFLLKWGQYGAGPGEFKLPFQVVVDTNNNAYVSDYYNTRLVKYSLPAGGGGGGTNGSAHFSNVSSRLRVNSARPLIAGFVVSGSAPKQVLIRAVGPTLAKFSVPNPLPNPKLLVYSSSSELLAENEDWGGDAAVTAAAARLGAFGLEATSRDAALLVTLPPGLYSAQVADNGGDGVAVVEVYDADAASTARIVNLSTRGFAGTADGVLVAGFVVSGNTPKRVLVRGIGPTLANFSVPDSMADPVLQVFDAASTLVAQNDDWETAQSVAGGGLPATAAQISAANGATGAFELPAASRDCAVLVTLAPGLYSAVVSGAGNTTGTALVELYEVP